MMRVYVDAHVFIFALLFTDDERAQEATRILRKIAEGELVGVTSALTVNEVVWKVLREKKDRKIAVQAGLKILQFPNMRIANADEESMRKMLEIMMKNELKPRDAVHCAAAYAYDCSAIVSDNADFDRIKEMKRIKLTRR